MVSDSHRNQVAQPFVLKDIDIPFLSVVRILLIWGLATLVVYAILAIPFAILWFIVFAAALVL